MRTPKLQEVSFHETLCLVSGFQASRLVKLTRPGGPECVALSYLNDFFEGYVSKYCQTLR